MERSVEQAKPSLFRTIIGMMINPARALRGALASRWYLAAAVSALAFGLFFGQTGFDLYKTGQKELGFVLLSAGAGLAYGLVLIPLLGAVLWLILKTAKTDKSLLQAVSAFCLVTAGPWLWRVGIVFSWSWAGRPR